MQEKSPIPCVECQTPFVQQRRTQRFCSKPCKIRWSTREWRRKNPERAKELDKNRPPEQRAKRNAFVREWHAAHKDEQNAKRREWHGEHREHANSQRIAHYFANHEQNRAKSKVRYRQTRLDTPWSLLLWNIKHRSKAKGLAFTLTEEWAESVWTGRCAITDIPFDLGSGTHWSRMMSPSVDRIVPALGYTPENSRFILWAVNAFKGTGTDETMFAIARAIVDKNP